MPIALALVLALGGPVGLASASPGSSVSSARATLARAIQDYDEARARLSAIEASVSAEAAELDSVVARQAELEEALDQRAGYLYRSGPLPFIEVLLQSNNFNDFLTRWDALVRMGREDAKTIAEIKASRTHLSQVVKRLLERQTAASRDLRALEEAKAGAQRTLSSSQAEYAAYQRQIAAREAAAANAVRASTPGPTSSAASMIRVASSKPSGSSAPWQSAVASCYGSGSYGVHLASGYTIGPDSMIVAHKTLPFGTLVEFAYRGRTAIATVADRGPFVPGRTWDLGPGTARVLGFEGVGTVRYRVVRR